MKTIGLIGGMSWESSIEYYRIINKAVRDRLGGLHISLLHIADATAERIKAQGLGRIGLLGTKFTMEEDFYKGRLVEKHGLDVIIPS